MALTKEQQQQAVTYLDLHFKDERKCNVCGENKWMIHPELYELRKLSSGAFIARGSLIPLLVIECEHCGKVLTLNAKKAGLLGTKFDNR